MRCSQGTVGSLLDDARAVKLDQALDHYALDVLLAERCPERVDYRGWKSIDEHELQAGRACGRPRLKLVEIAGMMAAINGAARRRAALIRDRKSVVEGKRVSVRVDLGGRRFLQ